MRLVKGETAIHDWAMGLFDAVQNALAKRNARKHLEKNPVLRAAMIRSNLAFDSTGMTEFSDETKDALSQQLLERVYQIVLSDDQVATCRQHFTDAVLELSIYQVLVLPPYPEEDDTGLRGTQGISGELKPLLLEVAQVNEHIKEEVYGAVAEPTYDDVWNTVLFRYWRSWWFAETFNACRKELGDYNLDKNRDWYKPFLHANCVFYEGQYRDELDLEPALGIDKFDLVPIMYSTFTQSVLGGAKYPDLHWREHYSKAIKGGELRPPFPPNNP